jgi:hypothetical protein
VAGAGRADTQYADDSAAFFLLGVLDGTISDTEPKNVSNAVRESKSANDSIRRESAKFLA